MPPPAPLLPAPIERRSMGLLAFGQTPAETLRLPASEAEAILESLLRRCNLSARHQLLACALLHRRV